MENRSWLFFVWFLQKIFVCCLNLTLESCREPESSSSAFKAIGKQNLVCLHTFVFSPFCCLSIISICYARLCLAWPASPRLFFAGITQIKQKMNLKWKKILQKKITNCTICMNPFLYVCSNSVYIQSGLNKNLILIMLCAMANGWNVKI